MIITTLGTSHGSHTPTRFNSCTLFEINQQTYLVDAGAPVEGLMIRAGKKIDDIKSIFITHMHNDHVGGLPGLIKEYLKRASGEQHLDIYMPEPDAHVALMAWLKAQHLDCEARVSFHCTVVGEVFSGHGLAVSAIATKHLVLDPSVPSSFSFVFQSADKRVLYTGDLAGDFSDFPLSATCTTVDLCICEATHYPMDKALPVLAKAPIKKLIFNHVGNQWHGEGEAVLLEMIKALPFSCELAADGSVFEV